MQFFCACLVINWWLAHASIAVCVAGQIFDQDWRLVVCGDTVGDSDVVSVAALQRTRRQSSDSQLSALRRRRLRSGRPAALSTRRVSSQHLRPDVAVLVGRQFTAAHVLPTAHVLTTRKPALPTSGAGANLIVGAPVRSKSRGTEPAQSAGKIVFWSYPSTFFGSKSTISRFGERFRDGQYSLVSFLFAVLLLTVAPVPSHLQKWGHVSPVPHGVGATATNPSWTTTHRQTSSVIARRTSVWQSDVLLPTLAFISHVIHQTVIKLGCKQTAIIADYYYYFLIWSQASCIQFRIKTSRWKQTKNETNTYNPMLSVPKKQCNET